MRRVLAVTVLSNNTDHTRNHHDALWFDALLSICAFRYVIYAAIGVQLFAKVKLSSTLTAHANFQSFGNAMVRAMQVLVGSCICSGSAVVGVLLPAR